MIIVFFLIKYDKNNKKHVCNILYTKTSIKSVYIIQNHKIKYTLIPVLSADRSHYIIIIPKLNSVCDYMNPNDLHKEYIFIFYDETGKVFCSMPWHFDTNDNQYVFI